MESVEKVQIPSTVQWKTIESIIDEISKLDNVFYVETIKDGKLFQKSGKLYRPIVPVNEDIKKIHFSNNLTSNSLENEKEPTILQSNISKTISTPSPLEEENKLPSSSQNNIINEQGENVLLGDTETSSNDSEGPPPPPPPFDAPPPPPPPSGGRFNKSSIKKIKTSSINVDNILFKKILSHDILKSIFENNKFKMDISLGNFENISLLDIFYNLITLLNNEIKKRSDTAFENWKKNYKTDINVNDYIENLFNNGSVYSYEITMFIEEYYIYIYKIFQDVQLFIELSYFVDFIVKKITFGKMIDFIERTLKIPKDKYKESQIFFELIQHRQMRATIFDNFINKLEGFKKNVTIVPGSDINIDDIADLNSQVYNFYSQFSNKIENGIMTNDEFNFVKSIKALYINLYKIILNENITLNGIDINIKNITIKYFNQLYSSMKIINENKSKNPSTDYSKQIEETKDNIKNEIKHEIQEDSIIQKGKLSSSFKTSTKDETIIIQYLLKPKILNDELEIIKEIEDHKSMTINLYYTFYNNINNKIYKNFLSSHIIGSQLTVNDYFKFKNDLLNDEKNENERAIKNEKLKCLQRELQKYGLISYVPLTSGNDKHSVTRIESIIQSLRQDNPLLYGNMFQDIINIFKKIKEYISNLKSNNDSNSKNWVEFYEYELSYINRPDIVQEFKFNNENYFWLNISDKRYLCYWPFTEPKIGIKVLVNNEKQDIERFITKNQENQEKLLDIYKKCSSIPFNDDNLISNFININKKIINWLNEDYNNEKNKKKKDIEKIIENLEKTYGSYINTENLKNELNYVYAFDFKRNETDIETSRNTLENKMSNAIDQLDIDEAPRSFDNKKNFKIIQNQLKININTYIKSIFEYNYSYQKYFENQYNFLISETICENNNENWLNKNYEIEKKINKNNIDNIIYNLKYNYMRNGLDLSNFENKLNELYQFQIIITGVENINDIKNKLTSDLSSEIEKIIITSEDISINDSFTSLKNELKINVNSFIELIFTHFEDQQNLSKNKETNSLNTEKFKNDVFEFSNDIYTIMSKKEIIDNITEKLKNIDENVNEFFKNKELNEEEKMSSIKSTNRKEESSNQTLFEYLKELAKTILTSPMQIISS